jgi:sigma-B regulation protein RsbU (phosphoserine phosphatase)
MYTDGVTEPISEEGEEFGERRLLSVIANNSERSCRDIVSRISAAVTSFTGAQPDFDDYTLVSLKRGT